jgi:hypothetical protein
MGHQILSEREKYLQIQHRGDSYHKKKQEHRKRYILNIIMPKYMLDFEGMVGKSYGPDKQDLI